MLALIQAPSPKMAECELSYLSRTAIDFPTAVQQHAGYGELLRQCGVDVRVLNANTDEPDGVFIEDVAVVLDEVGILTRMGSNSRRNEPQRIASELRKHREVVEMKWPATLEGGDVLRIGRTLLVGLSSRTNADGIQQLREVAEPQGYRVRPIRVTGCLHLKTAATALPDGRLLVNPQWLALEDLSDFNCLTVPPEEPWAANTLLIEDKVCLAAENDRTVGLLTKLGHNVRTCALSEFAKAEGGITCLSLLLCR